MLPCIRHCLGGRIKANRSPPTVPAEAKEGSPPTAHVNQHPGSRMKTCQPFQGMRIHIVPSRSYLLPPETRPILIPVEIHRFFLGRHLGSRQKTALPTPKQFLPVSYVHHRGEGRSAWAWNSIRECAHSHDHHARHTSQSNASKRPEVRSEENSTARASPRCRKVSLRWLTVRTSAIASLIAGTSSGSTRIAALATTSGIAALFPATTGAPHAMASNAGSPKPSSSDGSTNSAQPLYTDGRCESSITPGKRTRSMIPRSRTRPSSVCRCSQLPPAKTSW